MFDELASTVLLVCAFFCYFKFEKICGTAVVQMLFETFVTVFELVPACPKTIDLKAIKCNPLKTPKLVYDFFF